VTWAVSRPFETLTGIDLTQKDAELKMYTRFNNFKSDLFSLPLSDRTSIKKLKGDFDNGKLTGMAEYWFPDGRRFDGHFVDRETGRGWMLFPNGQYCSGNFKDLKKVKNGSKCFDPSKEDEK